MTAAEIKQRRERLGLTQEELADAFAMSLHGVRKWENGQREALRGSNVLERAFRELEAERGLAAQDAASGPVK